MVTVVVRTLAVGGWLVAAMLFAAALSSPTAQARALGVARVRVLLTVQGFAVAGAALAMWVQGGRV